MEYCDWWSLPRGQHNSICDIAGVTVGHETVQSGSANTGVTAILPHGGDVFAEPVHAASVVHNGFGKSLGLLQLQEMGLIETPILLTNTFSVPACATALIEQTIARHPQVGRDMATVNSLVLECNDGQVNDIQAMHVTTLHAKAAIEAASTKFAQGSVGAGTGMRSFGYAGGIGTASRMVGEFTLGALVLSNFGQMQELRVKGKRVPCAGEPNEADKGSIIMVLATDAPLDTRQLGRLCNRAPAALGRLGSFIGNGSGDISIAFSTANRFKRGDDAFNGRFLTDKTIDGFFLAVVEAIEDAVLQAMWHGISHTAYDGSHLPAFRPHFQRLNS